MDSGQKFTLFANFDSKMPEDFYTATFYRYGTSLECQTRHTNSMMTSILLNYAI